MSKSPTSNVWREERRQSARDAIVDAAWRLVREEGLAALSLRDLAKHAGITTPTVYEYFDSKNAIYDAMFGSAAAEFADSLDQLPASDDPGTVLTAAAHRFVEFSTSDVARYQLLFQRTIPGFEPTPEAFVPAVRALDGLRRRFAVIGVTEARHIDLWTAMTTGLVDQQIANEPGGDRWTRLIDDLVSMFLAFCITTQQPHQGAES